MAEKVLCVKRKEEAFCVESPLLSTVMSSEYNRIHKKETPYMIQEIYDAYPVPYPDSDDFILLDRGAELEANEAVQQLVVGMVITTKKKDRMLLMQCQKGDMQGFLTLVEGHVNDCPYETISVARWLFHEMMREYNEELSIQSKHPIDNAIFPLFATSNNYNKEQRSYFHMGIIFENIISEENFNLDVIKTGEPGINEPVILKVSDILDPESHIHVDDWVYSIAEYYKWESSRV